MNTQIEPLKTPQEIRSFLAEGLNEDLLATLNKLAVTSEEERLAMAARIKAFHEIGTVSAAQAEAPVPSTVPTSATQTVALMNGVSEAQKNVSTPTTCTTITRINTEAEVTSIAEAKPVQKVKIKLRRPAQVSVLMCEGSFQKLMNDFYDARRTLEKERVELLERLESLSEALVIE